MKIERNPGCELDIGWLNSVAVNLTAVNRQAKRITSSRELRDEHKAAWLLRAVTCIDLTTLAGDDTQSNVSRLCYKATRPLNESILNKLGFRVEDAVTALKKLGKLNRVKVASVATGFPSGQVPLSTRLAEIRYAVEKGAQEIDIVIDRGLVLTGKWEELYQEIQHMKEACGPDVHLKAILATGELGTLDNVYRASLVAMMAGSDFIKTSTGKEAVNATIPFGIVMCRAIKDYYRKMGYKVGLKPAGGVRTAQDAIDWLVLIKELLGDEWLNSELFRFGASGLLGDLDDNLYRFVTGKYPAGYEFLMG